VSLKEYLLTIFAFEREMTDREKVFVNLRFELAERALQLDHVEMLRRLDLLNHAQEDARQKEASFVGREVHESQVKDSNKWRDEVNSALSNRQGKASLTSGLAGALRGPALSALFAMTMCLAKAVLSGFPKYPNSKPFSLAPHSDISNSSLEFWRYSNGFSSHSLADNCFRADSGERDRRFVQPPGGEPRRKMPRCYFCRRPYR
jgi:hypothetical protein